MTSGKVTVRVIVASGMVIVILVTTGSLTAGAAEAPRVKANAKREASVNFMGICSETQGRIYPERDEEK